MEFLVGMLSCFIKFDVSFMFNNKAIKLEKMNF